MASVSSAGIGSGLDVPALVEKLVTAEGDPVRSRLDRKEAKLQAGLSAIGTLKSALSEFQSSLGGFQKMESLQSMAATSDDEGIINGNMENPAVKIIPARPILLMMKAVPGREALDSNIARINPAYASSGARIVQE